MITKPARLFHMWLALGVLLATGAAQSQPRTEDDKIIDPDHIAQIKRAVLDRVNVDDDATRAVAFGERTLLYFDRDRDGAFYDSENAWGLYDLDLAIHQFVHDTTDQDDDGLPGFYELECERAGGPSLDPTVAQTTLGIDDGTVDCDGDGIGSLVELQFGLNPLDPGDAIADSDHDGISDSQEQIDGTPHLPVVSLESNEPDGGDRVTIQVVLDENLGAPQPSICSFFINFDAGNLSYVGAELGPAAAAAGASPDRLFASDIGGTVRANLINNEELVEVGTVASFHFERIGDGPYAFTFDLQQTTFAPPNAREGLTYGLGHPDSPLIVEGD